MQQIYKEEISTIDMITEITVKKQFQEHIPDIHTQYHTPYVGPLMEVWAACLKPDSLSITASNPCNDQPDDCDFEETLFCLSMDKAVEGLVSLDDLEPSADSPLKRSSEALPITPNPECFVQNYCTLTNTAIGLIPTFYKVQHVPNLDLGLNGHTSSDLLNIQIEENTPELDTVTLDNLQMSMEE